MVFDGTIPPQGATVQGSKKKSRFTCIEGPIFIVHSTIKQVNFVGSRQGLNITLGLYFFKFYDALHTGIIFALSCMIHKLVVVLNFFKK